MVCRFHRLGEILRDCSVRFRAIMSARQGSLECLRRTAEPAARFLTMLGPIDAEIAHYTVV
jgi:hypothetical protein